jgi:hypothetical protein
VDKKEKRHIRIAILDIQDKHCKGCKKVAGLSSDANKHIRFAICRECEVGKLLESLGNKLEEKREKKVKVTPVKESERLKCCKENYEKLSAEGKSHADIAAVFGFPHDSYLYYHLNKWGIKSKKKQDKPKSEVVQKKPEKLEQKQPDQTLLEKITQLETKNKGLEEAYRTCHKIADQLNSQLETTKAQIAELDTQNGELIAFKNSWLKERVELLAKIEELQGQLSEQEAPISRDKTEVNTSLVETMKVFLHASEVAVSGEEATLFLTAIESIGANYRKSETIAVQLA